MSKHRCIECGKDFELGGEIAMYNISETSSALVKAIAKSKGVQNKSSFICGICLYKFGKSQQFKTLYNVLDEKARARIEESHRRRLNTVVY